MSADLVLIINLEELISDLCSATRFPVQKAFTLYETFDLMRSLWQVSLIRQCIVKSQPTKDQTTAARWPTCL